MNAEKYIVGLGEVLFDCLPSGRQLGGAPANFAFHASQFGLHGVAVSAIGRDALGEEVKRLLDAKRLEYHLETVSYPTGTVQVTLDTQGIPAYDICEGVAYDNIPFSEEMARIARHTQCACFGTLAQRGEVSRESIHRFLATMPAGSMKVFDINLRQQWYSREVIEQSLHACTILKINDEEIEIVARMLDLGTTPAAPFSIGDAEQPCRALMNRYGIEIVVLTCGVNGSMVFWADGASLLPTPKVTVADTVGAGDSFTGAFCASLLQGKSVSEAHRVAVEVSAYVCSQHGAMPLLPAALTAE
ncbi:MAG: carbohydrate kinase [Bacteroidales bacterium]|nr:carbohydrate kinase [Bacteroidales bacterium]